MTAQQTTTMALEKAVAPKEPRTDSVADFKRLNPKEFIGTIKPLEEEQWLVDTENLIAATNIPADNHVEVVKIQLTNITRSWWLAEEQRLTKPISWKYFTDNFYERLFPKTAQREMEQQFVSLK